MPRRHRGFHYLSLQLASDALAVDAGLAVSYWLRFHSGLIPATKPWDPADYLRVFPVAWALWLLSLRLTHCYNNHPVALTFNTARRLLKGSMLAVAMIVAYEHFTRVAEFSRALYPIALLITLGALIAGRAALQWIIRGMLRGGKALRARVLIVGVGPLARRLAARCKIHPEYAYEIVGYVTHRPEQVGRKIGDLEVLGHVADLAELIQRHNVHEVFVTNSEMPPGEYLRLALESERETAQIRIVPNMVEMMTGDVFYDEIAGIPLFMIKETPLQGWNAFIKRIVDIAGSTLLLALLAPFYLVVAWLIRRDSPGPVIYRQKRIGVDGREFTIFKFRTMRVDAEANGPVWGGREDERCTRIGRILRRWDLDELPQLWNVLLGDMSLVGPRPERPEFVAEFKRIYPRYMARLRVRAGMTGWAQVHGLRGDTPLDQRIQYDLYYIENWSYWLDLKILIMTIFRREDPLGARAARGENGASAASSLPVSPAAPAAVSAPVTPPAASTSASGRFGEK